MARNTEAGQTSVCGTFAHTTPELSTTRSETRCYRRGPARANREKPRMEMPRGEELFPSTLARRIGALVRIRRLESLGQFPRRLSAAVLLRVHGEVGIGQLGCKRLIAPLGANF